LEKNYFLASIKHCQSIPIFRDVPFYAHFSASRFIGMGLDLYIVLVFGACFGKVEKRGLFLRFLLTIGVYTTE
jgi:hypothetical protein